MAESDSCDISEIMNMYDAMIRFFFKENPVLLSDEDYAVRIKELTWLSKEGFLKGTHL
ncbi:MAG: hypothetical protein PHP99_09155 [Paludibacter sp.]|nr:hypothetical protein [Paludibacter sp.]